jgi:uncharacterized phage protein gp47/JayE
MPNVIDDDGLQINTLKENTDYLSAAFRDIYGQDIIIDSNSPDGQIIGIFAQFATNILEKLAQSNSSFDVLQAGGVYLDQRSALMGIRRIGATYTIASVTLTATAAVSLAGLDDDFYNINGASYSLQDVTGNVWFLVDSTILQPGDNTLLFRAQKIGRVDVIPHAINKQYSTPVPQVTKVDNPTAAAIVGQDGETDPVFRDRILRSYGMGGTAAIESLTARLSNIEGMQSVMVYENVTPYTDGNGVPPHGIWVIVNGGTTDEIGKTIADIKGFGVSMKDGAYYWTYVAPNGVTTNIYFDRAIPEPLKMKVNVYLLRESLQLDMPAIKQKIVDSLRFAIGEVAEVGTITCIVNTAIGEQGGGAYPTAVGLWTDNQPGYHSSIYPSSKINVFSVSPFDIEIEVDSH